MIFDNTCLSNNIIITNDNFEYGDPHSNAPQPLFTVKNGSAVAQW